MFLAREEGSSGTNTADAVPADQVDRGVDLSAGCNGFLPSRLGASSVSAAARCKLGAPRFGASSVHRGCTARASCTAAWRTRDDHRAVPPPGRSWPALHAVGARCAAALPRDAGCCHPPLIAHMPGLPPLCDPR